MIATKFIGAGEQIVRCFLDISAGRLSDIQYNDSGILTVILQTPISCVDMAM